MVLLVSLLILFAGIIMSIHHHLPFEHFSVQKLGTLFWILAIFLVIFAVASQSGPKRSSSPDIEFEFERINNKYDEYKEEVFDLIDEFRRELPRQATKLIKEFEKKEASKASQSASQDAKLLSFIQSELQSGTSVAKLQRKLRPLVFVIEFYGDIQASEVSTLSAQVSVLLKVASEFDEVVCVLQSFGGLVFNYGLAASELARLRQAGIRTTVCIDIAAASGGYMMACVADRIVAAPSALVGSIGVVSYRPNIQKVLKKANVDLYLLTAGKHKRTIDIVGDVTEEGIAKAKEELVDMHSAFKAHIKYFRPQIDIEEVATGEAWLAIQSIEKNLNLVDELMTSSQYITNKSKTCDVIKIKLKKKKGLKLFLDNMQSSISKRFQSFMRTAEKQATHPLAVPI